MVLLTDLTHHDFCLIFVLETFFTIFTSIFCTLHPVPAHLAKTLTWDMQVFTSAPFVKVLMSLCFSFHVVSCDVFSSCIMYGSVLYNFDNKFIFIVVVLTCLLELFPTIRCQRDLFNIHFNYSGIFCSALQGPMRGKSDWFSCTSWLIWLNCNNVASGSGSARK